MIPRFFFSQKKGSELTLGCVFFQLAWHPDAVQKWMVRSCHAQTVFLFLLRALEKHTTRDFC